MPFKITPPTGGELIELAFRQKRPGPALALVTSTLPTDADAMKLFGAYYRELRDTERRLSERIYLMDIELAENTDPVFAENCEAQIERDRVARRGLNRVMADIVGHWQDTPGFQEGFNDAL